MAVEIEVEPSPPMTWPGAVASVAVSAAVVLCAVALFWAVAVSDMTKRGCTGTPLRIEACR